MAGAVGGGLYRGPSANNPETLRLQDEQRQRELSSAQHGLQMAGTSASTARANSDQALQTAAPWQQVGNVAPGDASSPSYFAQQARQSQGMSNSGMSQPEYEHELGAAQMNRFGTQQREQESQLQAGAEQRRFNMFQPYLDKFGSSFSSQGGGDVPQHVDFGGLNGAESAAQSAAFARAKDQAGLIGRSAVNSLNNVMGGRGLSGSGLAANGAGGVINQQATQLGEVNREQAIQGANIARQRASEQYQGGIEQRGQDISAINAKRSQMLGLLNGFPGSITARY